jgi:dTDP-4-amino-4,6-dideoxygalactose transaminase
MTVDLFGLSGAPPELRELTRRRSLPLIRDLAQCTPSEIALRPLEAEVAILSFGRGKPISLLGGGAILLSQTTTPTPACEIDRSLHFGAMSHLVLALKVAAYNLAVRPVSFALLRKIPWLRIGESSLVITDRAVRYSKGFEALVVHQVLVAERTRVHREAQVKKLAAVARRLGLQAVKGALSDQVPGSASRVPVLAPTAWHADQAAKAAGHLGVSRMYKKTLAEFVGTSAAQAMHTWPSAYDLSRRLLTLPAHGRLSETSLLQLEETLGVVLEKQP